MRKCPRASSGFLPAGKPYRFERKDGFKCRPCGEKQVKGIHHDVLVYEVGME